LKNVVVIIGLSHDGRGVARQEGKTLFVEGALVGEKVVIEYTKRKSRYDEAKISSLIKPAPSRKTPKCQHFNTCGGCSLQHMGSQAQIAYKQDVLLEQLHHIGQVKPKTILPPILAEDYYYRRKARLGVRYVLKKDKLLIGFREKKGRYLADIEICPILDKSIGKKIPLIREFLLRLDGYLCIPQLEIAVGDTQTAIIIRHIEPLSARDLDLIEQFAKSEDYHIYLQPGGIETVQSFFPAKGSERLSYRLNDYDLEILFHPTDFTQVNARVNQKLINLAIELLAPGKQDEVLDLFCGIGNFTLPLSRFCKRIIGIEGNELMVARGYENARHNQIKNAEFRCQNLTQNGYTESWMGFRQILLDPPRTGAWQVVQELAKTNAKRIVYVSCNPATFSRDAGFLIKNGFELSVIGVLDMFPHTSHVESIALFNKTRD
jgi:23S rRNA (uracil1939-C5)-methyltransferase